MKTTTHANVSATPIGNQGGHRRAAIAGLSDSPADAFAQLLSGLGDPAEETPTGTTGVAEELVAGPSGDSPSSSAPTTLGSQPADVMDQQAIAILLGQTPATVSVAGLQATDLTNAAPVDGQALGLDTGMGRFLPKSGHQLFDKPDLPNQAASRASIASGREPTESETSILHGKSAQAHLPSQADPGRTTALSTPAHSTDTLTENSLTGEELAVSSEAGSTAQVYSKSAASSSSLKDAVADLKASTQAFTAETSHRTIQVPGRLVSQAARNSATTGSPAHGLPRLATEDESRTRSWQMLTPGQPGSGLATSEPANTLSAVVNAASNSQSTEDRPDKGQSDNGTGQAAAVASEHQTATGVSEPMDATPGSAPVFSRSFDQAMQALGAQVSLWSSQKLQQATMDLDTGDGKSLQVDVTLNDGQVELRFRSDDALTREVIRAHAPGALGDLLGRNGMDLTGLTVAAQGFGQSAGKDSGSANPGRSSRSEQALEQLAAIEPANRSRIVASDRALDLYA